MGAWCNHVFTIYGRMGDAATGHNYNQYGGASGSVFFFEYVMQAVLLGNELGSDRLEQAEEHAKELYSHDVCLITGR